MIHKRVFLIILDSFGIGELPDALEYGDIGSNTLKSITKSKLYDTPNLKKLGLFNIDTVDYCQGVSHTLGSIARLAEMSKGKDTSIGHWEIAGIISENPLPTYKNGFPSAVMDEFAKKTGRKLICNKPYSGTEVLKDFGREHMESGALIVYTSADSVFQIAAHESIVTLDELYKYCKIAREILKGEHAVGRVIARPFIGEYPEYTRTSNRHDFSLLPPKTTILDVLNENGYDTIAVGKIFDIFAGKGIQETTSIKNNVDGMEKTLEIMNKDFSGLCFVNLVDFDMLYGHRNDVDGYANAASVFDKQLATFIEKMKDDDILILSADHGCDPESPGTDHSREYVPMIAYGKGIKENINLGTRKSFSDIAMTIADIFELDKKTSGESFYKEICK